MDNMLTRDGDRLAVFENFIVDRELPKHKKRGKRRDALMSKGGELDLTDDNEDSMMEESDGEPKFSNQVIWREFGTANSVATLQVQVGAPGASKPKASTWKFWAKKQEPIAVTPVLLSIEEFFSSVKNTAKELEVVKERALGYERAMVNAKKAGQAALYEKLAAGLNAFRMETQLVSIGLTKYIEEDTIVEHYKKSKVGLRLDWVKNFTRVIPESIVAVKARADELGIFDNYVVLHYDPTAKAFSETKEEVAARKDPILFGLMNDRTQLYFVGDWIDEYCDLTLDKLAEAIGTDAVRSIVSGHPYRTGQ